MRGVNGAGSGPPSLDVLVRARWKRPMTRERCSRPWVWPMVAIVVAWMGGVTPLQAQPSSTSAVNVILDGAVKAAARDGNTLFVGGDFTTAAPSANALPLVYGLSSASGAVTAPAFPVVDNDVLTIEPDGARGVFVAGRFSTIGTFAQRALAHVRADGTVDPLFRPVLDGEVRSVARVGSRLFLVGTFTTIGGTFAGGIGSVSAVDGARLDWTPGLSGVPDAVVAATDRVLVRIVVPGAGIFRTSAALGAYDPATAAQLWRVVYAPRPFIPVSIGHVAVAGGHVILDVHGFQRFGLTKLSLATGDEDPTWSVPTTGGEVRASAVSGTTLYIGGGFVDVGGQPRRGIAAVDLGTGVVLPWNPDADGAVTALSLSVSGTVFVSGAFDHVGTLARRRLAEVDASGVPTPWTAEARPLQVFGLAADVTPGAVLVASSLAARTPTPRSHLAAVDVATGAMLPWAPTADGDITLMAASAGRVWLAGAFTAIDGHAAPGVAVLDAATGTFLPWTPASAGTPLFADDTYWYWQTAQAAGPSPPLPVVQRYVLASGARDAVWQDVFLSASAGLARGDVVYLSGGHFQAVDRTNGHLLWSNFTITGGPLAAFGDTLYVPSGGDVVGYDARTGRLIRTLIGVPQLGQPAAATIAGGHLVMSSSSSTRRLFAYDLDGNPSAWQPLTGVVESSQSPATDYLATLGDVLIVGSPAARATTPARQGLAVYPVGGSIVPELRTQPRGSATEFLWSAPQLPPGGYVIEAGVSPWDLRLSLPVAQATSFTAVVPATYFLRVRARDTSGASDGLSNLIVAGTGCAAPPPAPTGLDVALDAVGTGVVFSWTPPSGVVGSQTLAAGAASGTSSYGSVVQAATASQFAVNGPIPAGTFFVRAYASNACGTSGPSGEVVFASPLAPKPSPPSTFRATVTSTTVSLAWDAAPSGTGYVLEAGTAPGLADLARISLGVSNSLVIPGVPPGRYFLRMRTLSDAGSSAPSGDIRVVVR